MYANIGEVKASLSKLLKLLDSGQESEIIICKRNKPVARLVSFEPKQAESRSFGVFKGRYDIDPNVDFFESDEEIAHEF